jgi:hypothetical protein
MSSDTATIIYSYFFVTAGVLTALSFIAKATIKKHTEAIEDQLSKIEYALFNDGKTGLINKVDQLIENQSIIKIDVEVMKAKYEKTPARRKARSA